MAGTTPARSARASRKPRSCSTSRSGSKRCCATPASRSSSRGAPTSSSRSKSDPAIATREQADLFLSIHANASRSRAARGIETYILNFANDPDAVAVAVRENASTERRMNNLPDIVKAITLNNKLDESRSFAGLVQRALAQQLRSAGGPVVDHGVKQAPFVVLIGAAMPSVLVEISFITHPQEGRQLKTPAFRQRIAAGAVRGDPGLPEVA